MQRLFKSSSAERISHDAVWKPHQTVYTLTEVFELEINPQAVVFFVESSLDELWCGDADTSFKVHQGQIHLVVS